MSCDWCVHFLPERDEDSSKTDKGHCTLKPAWVAVSKAHYCGQIQYGADKFSSERTTMVNRWSKDWGLLRNEQAKLQAGQKKLATEKRLVAAEKKLLKIADDTKKETP